MLVTFIFESGAKCCTASLRKADGNASAHVPLHERQLQIRYCARHLISGWYQPFSRFRTRKCHLALSSTAPHHLAAHDRACNAGIGPVSMWIHHLIAIKVSLPSHEAI